MVGTVIVRCSLSIVDRILQVAIGDPAHLLGHGGREQGRLAAAGRLRQDPLDVLDEAHAQHLVGFVQHDQLQRGQVQRAAPQVVHDAPRRADHDLHAAAQALQLFLDRLPAVDRQHAHGAEPAGVGVQGLGHLDGQLARGGQDQRLHRAGVGVELLQDGQRKGGRLAGAGRRLADHVAPGEQQRDRLALDGRRRLIAHIAYGAGQGLDHAKFFKGAAVVGLVDRPCWFLSNYLLLTQFMAQAPCTVPQAQTCTPKYRVRGARKETGRGG